MEENKYYQQLIKLTKAPLLGFIKIVNQLLENYNKNIITKEDLIQILQNAFKNFITKDQFQRQANLYIKPFSSLPKDKKTYQLITNIIIDKIDITFYIKLIIQSIIAKLNKEFNINLNFLIRTISLEPIYIKQQIDKYCSDEIIQYITQYFGEKIEEVDPYSLDSDKYKKGETIYTNVYPYDFPQIRSYPIVVLDQHILKGEKSETHNDIINRTRKNCQNGIDNRFNYNPQGTTILEQFGVENLAVGSVFNKIVLLEYITNGNAEEIIDGEISSNSGNLSVILNTLKNYSAVFLQDKVPFSSNKYKKEAKKLMKKLKR